MSELVFQLLGQCADLWATDEETESEWERGLSGHCPGRGRPELCLILA